MHARHKLTNQEVAIKVIDKLDADEDDVASLRQEATILKSCKHLGITQVIEILEDSQKLLIVM